MTPLVFVDVETGGLDENEHSLLEVGFVHCEDGEISRVYESYVRHDSYCITTEAMDLNNIDLHNVVLRGAEPAEVVEEVKEFLLRAGDGKSAILAGHNIGFDIRFLKRLFKNCGDDLMNYVNHRMLDTMGLLYALHDIGKVPEEALGLDGAVRFFGIADKSHHTALGDAVLAMRVYGKCLELMGNAA